MQAQGRLQFKGVAFDLDGLMFNTEELYFLTARETAVEFGGDFNREIMRSIMGRRGAESIETLRRMTGLGDAVEGFVAEVRTRFQSRLDDFCRPSPGLDRLLDRLDSLGIPRGVATSSSRAHAERLLNRHALINRFMFILSAEDVRRGKPDPEIYFTASRRLNAEPREIVVLEDSPAGIAAAKAAGAFAVAAPHEHSPAEGLAAADLIVRTLADDQLIQLFERSRIS